MGVTPETVALGERLRLAREQAGLSQGQVARTLGLHRPSVTESEAGRRGVSATELAQYAELYGVTTDWLSRGYREGHNPAIELAARELSRLSTDDLDTVLNLLARMKQDREAGR